MVITTANRIPGRGRAAAGRPRRAPGRYPARVTGDIRVVFRKYDGSRHWHLTTSWLGEDAHGIWVGKPAGTSLRKGDDPPIREPHASVGLLPRRAGWTGWFNAPPDALEIYCDVTTVPEWPAAGEVTMIDLDLDVVRTRADGSVQILDEDEFAAHRVRYGYPDDVVAEATRTAQWLQAALRRNAEPFAGAYRRWLALVDGAAPPGDR